MRDLTQIAVCTVDGQEFAIGDAETPFCVQSCSKPINYLIALEELGPEEVHKHVGKEPSGQEFNKIFLNKDNLPHNPMINSGAITICSMIRPQLEPWERYAYIRKYWQRAAGGRKIGFQNSVYMSERETGDKNKAIINLLMDNRVLPPETHLEDSLNLYFQACSFEADCRTMATIAATFARSGRNPFTQEQVFKPRNVAHCLELMLSNGLYDQSGEWAFKIGVPAKSGVSGCIFLVIPPVMGVAIWSPLLDEKGNSVKGVRVSELLAQAYSIHRYDTLRGVLSPFSDKKNLMLRADEELLHFQIRLFAAAAEDDIYEFSNLLQEVQDFDPDRLRDHAGRTLAHIACFKGAKKILKALVGLGADLKELKDEAGHTALEKARLGGHPGEWIVEMCRRLFRKN